MILRLRPLTDADEAEALAAHDELLADDFEFLLDRRDGESWPGYVARLERVRRGQDLRPGWVPASFLVADVEGRLVGRLSLRHRLTGWLEEYGGHVGYGVRPAFRRRGYATEMLRQGLDAAAAVGVERALVTCDPDNVGSATVIERCGGVFERLSVAGDGEAVMRRYWVPTGATGSGTS